MGFRNKLECFGPDMLYQPSITNTLAQNKNSGITPG
jgi:hypothetical protein